MRAVLLAGCLWLCACAAGAEFVGAAVRFEGLDTAAKVLSRLGPPCFTSGDPGGVEVWHYCAAQCPPPDAKDWCMGECINPCPTNEWAFYIASGVVVKVDGPYK